MSVGRAAYATREREDAGDQQELVAAAFGAGLGEAAQVPELVQRHALQRDQPPVQEALSCPAGVSSTTCG